MTHTPYHRPTTLTEAAKNRRYQGKIVIESPEGIYSTHDDEKANQMLKRLHKKYPQQPPVSTVIPKGIMVPLPFHHHK